MTVPNLKQFLSDASEPTRVPYRLGRNRVVELEADRNALRIREGDKVLIEIPVHHTGSLGTAMLKVARTALTHALFAKNHG